MQQQELIKLLEQQNEEGMAYLFKAYYPSLFLFAEKYISDSDHAQDIIQDVFLKIWENHQALNIKTSLSHYLFTAVRNGCIDYFRAQHIACRYQEKSLVGYTDTEEYTLNFVEDEKVFDKVKKLMEYLPEQCREVLEIRVMQEYKYKEIALRLNISENAVKVQLHRAYEKLRKLWHLTLNN